MKKALTCLMVAAGMALPAASALAAPQDDLKAFRAYYADRFPDTPFEDFKNGIYSIDKPSRDEWESIEEFPPYELSIDNGEAMWGEAFANGKTYASCFGDDVSTIRARYPHWDSKEGIVRTLEEDINSCRVANGEKPLKYKRGKIADLSAYVNFQGRGTKINVEMPDDPKALETYEKGKKFFYTKRGQLNLACADCHVYNAGNKVRTEKLSPALGHPTNWPVYRSKWGNMGTLHRRYGGCNEQVRAKAFKPQGPEYKALEFFQAYMSNGLEFNGPGARK